MIKLLIDNKYVEIRGAARSVIRLLERVCSYRVAGAHYSQAFRTKVWDGREHLLKFNTRQGYHAPIGMLEDIEKTLKKHKHEYEIDSSGRTPPRFQVRYKWNESIVLRPYQKQAVKAITSGPYKGTGILMLPIRSGKTKTAARAIHDLKAKTLFIVPGQLLLYQSQASLQEALGVEIGLIGDGEWSPKDITVATVQTLISARGGKRVIIENRRKKVITLPTDPRYKKLIGQFDLIVFDECHHLVAENWRAAMLDFDVAYRIGLSATVFLDSEAENERGVIWLKACCGGIRHSVTTSELIESGYLMRPIIHVHEVTEPNLLGVKWSKTLQDKAIYANDYRNNLIVKIAKKHYDDGLHVLIVTNRLLQIEELERLLVEAKLPHETITGNDNSEQRQLKVANFTSGDCRILMGTVFGEGIDIPEIECVINAEGGLDAKSTIQRMRNLTIAENKRHAIFVDFADLTNNYFANHSRQRINLYRSEPAFKVKYIRSKERTI